MAGAKTNSPWLSRRRWSERSLRSRIAIGTLAAVLVLYVVAQLAGAVLGGSTPSGPTSSSYATTPSGLAAYASLLRNYGHPVQRIRTPLSRTDLPPRSVIILADPSSTVRSEVPTLRRLLHVGDTIVLTGARTIPAIQALLGAARSPTWSPNGSQLYHPVSPSIRAAGIHDVTTAGNGSWVYAHSTTPLLTSGAGYLAVAGQLGRGRLIMIADTSCLENQFLAQNDNAAFGLYLDGTSRSNIFFDEYLHGYGSGGSGGTTTGLSSLPVRWKWGLVLALVATLIWMWSRALRLGAPERLTRTMTPVRQRYVDAVAIEISRTHNPQEAVEPLRTAARDRIVTRLRLGPNSSAEEIAKAARINGIPEEVLTAVEAPVSHDSDVLALGRALAWLEGEKQ